MDATPPRSPRVAPAGHHDTADTASAGPRDLLTVEAAAARLSISRTRMYGLLKTGDVTSVKVGRLRRIPTTELAAFTARLLNNPPAA